MPFEFNQTGYARLTREQARLVLALLVITAIFFVGVTFSSVRQGNVGKQRPEAGDDVALYRAEVDRIQAGEGYYHAAAAELTARGYPTKSPFNWRTPLPMWLIGNLPDAELGKAVLCGLALAVMLVWFEALSRQQDNHPGQAVGAVLLLSGPLLPCLLADLFVMPVLWAGVLIALSIGCFGIGRCWLGVTTGIAAVFVRDLALPYCLLSALIAAWHRRWGELVGWLIGLAAWGAFFAMHWRIVSGFITPFSRAHAEGWIQFGGAGFVIAIAQMNAYLLLLPQWVTALYLVLALFGLAGWHNRLGLRCGLTACMFLTAFAIVGQEFNQYWGCLLTPLLCLGVVRVPASLRDLRRAAFGAQRASLSSLSY